MPQIADRITVDPEQCGGRPCIRGMRIRAVDVLDLLANGLSHQAVLERVARPRSRRHRRQPALRPTPNRSSLVGSMILLVDAQLLALDGVRLRRKDLVWNALGLFKDQGLDFSAALVAAEASAMGNEEIASYDPGLDRVAGVTRTEP